MARCEVCGNDYSMSFEVHAQGAVHVFDSFECAIHRMAPICEHCRVQVVGHGRGGRRPVVLLRALRGLGGGDRHRGPGGGGARHVIPAPAPQRPAASADPHRGRPATELYRRGVYRFLLTRQWVILTLLGLLVMPVMVELGVWQMHRHESEDATNARTAHALAVPSVPLEQLTAPGATVPAADNFRRVTAYRPLRPGARDGGPAPHLGRRLHDRLLPGHPAAAGRRPGGAGQPRLDPGPRRRDALPPGPGHPRRAR